MEQNFCSESNAGFYDVVGQEKFGFRSGVKKKIGSGLGIRKVGCFTQIPDFWYKCNQNYGWFLRHKVGVRVSQSWISGFWVPDYITMLRSASVGLSCPSKYNITLQKQKFLVIILCYSMFSIIHASIPRPIRNLKHCNYCAWNEFISIHDGWK